jgi:hypothetical protein
MYALGDCQLVEIIRNPTHNYLDDYLKFTLNRNTIISIIA